MSAFTHNDGRTALLLRCKGTLPVAYQVRSEAEAWGQGRLGQPRSWLTHCGLRA